MATGTAGRFSGKSSKRGTEKTVPISIEKDSSRDRLTLLQITINSYYNKFMTSARKLKEFSDLSLRMPCR